MNHFHYKVSYWTWPKIKRSIISNSQIIACQHIKEDIKSLTQILWQALKSKLKYKKQGCINVRLVSPKGYEIRNGKINEQYAKGDCDDKEWNYTR